MKACDNKKCSLNCKIIENSGAIRFTSGFKQELDVQEHQAGKNYAGIGTLSFCRVCAEAIKMALDNAEITTEKVE
jgi:hypothetical protein